MEKYTLCFNIKNRYGHEKDIPIIKLDLKSMDIFTGRYKTYLDLFNDLPSKIKGFIYTECNDDINLSDEACISKRIYLKNDKDDKQEVLLSKDKDVIYITPEELVQMIISEKMSFVEIEKAILKSGPKSKKYEFFKYLYDTYVRNKKIIGMMDTYDISKKLPVLKADDLMIAAIATDKDNLILLSKKIGQKSNDRRNFAIKFKEFFKDSKDNKSLIDNKLIEERFINKNSEELLDNMIECFDEFKKDYDKEYY